MSENEGDTIDPVVRALRRYIAAHPGAADTVVGIQRWWLAPAVDEPMPLVELALDRLIEEGVMRRVDMQDGSAIYSAARHDQPSHATHGPA
ncbi:hypothetical protein BH11GEM2_BH11GEM2_26340 [soil metagenome]